jgi:hypothetical protein
MCSGLIAELETLGHLPANSGWYVEWDGVYEFGLIPVFFGDCGQHCLNVYPNGDVVVFA